MGEEPRRISVTAERNVSLQGTKSFRQGDYLIYLRDSDVGAFIVEALLPEPDRLLATGEELVTAWYAGNTLKGSFNCRGKDYFYKKYQPKGFLYGIKNILRLSRALRAWHYSETFNRASIPTVAPILCVEKRRFGLLGPSYLVFPLMSGWDNLLTLWDRITDDQKLECMRVLGGVIGKMHRHGILHGDLNWRNLMLSTGPSGMQAIIIDLDGCKRVNKMDISLMEADLAHFVRDIERAGAEKWIWETFQRSWQSAVEQGY